MGRARVPHPFAATALRPARLSIAVATAAFLALCLAWSAPTAAGQPRESRAIVIRAARIIDATGAAPVTNGVIVVRDGRIQAVGARGTVEEPADADVVDLPRHTVIPGLIDTHSHLGTRYTGAGGGRDLEAQRAGPSNEQMLRVIRNARVQLLCGVTTIRELGEQNGNDILLRDAADAGMQVAPRVISAGLTISNTGGHGVGPHGTDGPDAVRRAVRTNIRNGATWIKLAQLDVTPDAAQMARDDLEAAIDEAHRLGVKVTVHATGRWGSAIRTAVAAGADGVEHVRPLDDGVVRLLLERRVRASLTPLVYLGWRPSVETWQRMDRGVSNCEGWLDYVAGEIAAHRRAHPEQETQDRAYEDKEPGRAARDMFQAVTHVQEQYLAAHKAGLRFGLGLDTWFGLQALQVEFLVEAGLRPLAAIQAATRDAAAVIDLEKELGTIETGKLADLVAVEGNPLERIEELRRIRFVMKAGERFDAVSWR